MKSKAVKFFLLLICTGLWANSFSQSSDVKTIYIFPYNFDSTSLTNLNEVRLIWQAEPVLFRYSDFDEELIDLLNKENLKASMKDPERTKEISGGVDYRLYCIITYEEGVNIYEDTSNIYLGFSQKNYMSIEYLDEKEIKETDLHLLEKLNALIPDKAIRKSVKKKIQTWQDN